MWHAREIVVGNPLGAVSAISNVAVSWPRTTVFVCVEGRSLQSTSPVPASATVCGLFTALSVSVSVPVRGPVAVGLNATVIAQLAPAASVPGVTRQVFV